MDQSGWRQQRLEATAKWLFAAGGVVLLLGGIALAVISTLLAHSGLPLAIGIVVAIWGILLLALARLPRGSRTYYVAMLIAAGVMLVFVVLIIILAISAFNTHSG